MRILLANGTTIDLPAATGAITVEGMVRFIHTYDSNRDVIAHFIIPQVIGFWPLTTEVLITTERRGK